MIKMETINIVVLNDSNTNKYIPFLRKKTSKSISDLKQDISMGNSVIECDYYDADELKFLVKSAEELKVMGASIKIYEDEEEITLDMVKNLIDTIEGVARDREEMDRLMSDDENE
jgi:hypothetical protein